MVEPICILLDRLEGREAIPCDSGCKYWKFPHLDCACVLSDVFSVKKREPCFEYTALVSDKNGEV